MLHINALTYRVAGRTLLERATVSVAKGERVGIVGRNGSGKTTLLRLIDGEAQPDEGAISVPAEARIGRMAQEAPSGPRSLLDIVLAADGERSRLLAEAEEASDAARISEIHERLAAIRADSAPARAARILAGFGFDERAQARACSEFSGGWRMRISLAALLFSEPDLLLLDEPTNHLDLEATLWLQAFLKTYPGTLLMVSHDRELLNTVADKIIHLDQCRFTAYRGNYDRFERVRREYLERQRALHAQQVAGRRRIQAFVDRFRAKASKARQAQSRLKALERMEPISGIIEEKAVSIEFPAPNPLPPPLLTLADVAVGYEPGKPVLRRLNLRLDMDDRVALLGPNGNGKSTFVKLLAGRLTAQSGSVLRPAKLKVGYFSQDQAGELDLDATPLNHLERLMPHERQAHLRAHLGSFGFTQDHALMRTEDLSGGERARLLFALMSREAPHILLLDEPTNHLDIDARSNLVQALGAFEGAVVLVTHDPHLIELVADRLWLVSDGTITPYDGDLDDYRRLLSEHAGQGRRVSPPNAARDFSSRKAKRRTAARTREAAAPLRQVARQAEARLEALTREKATLEAWLADPAIYQQAGEDLTGLQIRLAEVLGDLVDAEAAWLEAHEQIERTG